jgi:hypothetical protein
LLEEANAVAIGYALAASAVNDTQYEGGLERNKAVLSLSSHLIIIAIAPWIWNTKHAQLEHARPNSWVARSSTCAAAGRAYRVVSL